MNARIALLCGRFASVSPDVASRRGSGLARVSQTARGMTAFVPEPGLQATGGGWIVSLPISAAAAGDVHISIEADVLRVSDTRDEAHVVLPGDADRNSLSADFSAGTLTISIPRIAHGMGPALRELGSLTILGEDTSRLA